MDDCCTGTDEPPLLFQHCELPCVHISLDFSSSPPGNFVGMKSQDCVHLSRISTCPPGLSDSWAAERPEIPDRSTARWGGELYSMHALCLTNPKIVRPAVHMLCR